MKNPSNSTKMGNSLYSQKMYVNSHTFIKSGDYIKLTGTAQT